MNPRKLQFITAIAILFALVIIIGLRYSPQKVPDLSFTDIDGQTHSFREYQGKPLLVIFWATDCPGCIAEIPDLIALYQQYHADLAMLGIAMPHDQLSHIQALRQQRQIPYALTWDKEGRLTQAFDHVRVTPTHFLINPKGEIVMRKIGELDLDYLKHKLAKMRLVTD